MQGCLHTNPDVTQEVLQNCINSVLAKVYSSLTSSPGLGLVKIFQQPMFLHHSMKLKIKLFRTLMQLILYTMMWH